MISKLTKEALHSLRRKCKRLGSPQNLTQEARLKGVLAIKAKSLKNDNNRKSKSMIQLLNEKGMSLNKIAGELNRQGFKTSKGGIFQTMQVKDYLIE